jgi:hypothetical protein
VQTMERLKQLQAALPEMKPVPGSAGPAAGEALAVAKVGEREDVRRAWELLTGNPLDAHSQPSIELAVRTWPIVCSCCAI